MREQNQSALGNPFKLPYKRFHFHFEFNPILIERESPCPPRDSKMREKRRFAQKNAKVKKGVFFESRIPLNWESTIFQ